MLNLIIKLLIAHVIGDFVYQPDKWVEEKKNKPLKSRYFYFHGIVHLIALFVLLEFDPKYIPAISGGHLTSLQCFCESLNDLPGLCVD